MTIGRRAVAYSSALASRVSRSSLAQASAVYGLSTMANRAIPFALLPVLTRYLSPEDFGKAAMFTTAVSLTLPFVGVSTDSAVGRQYFEREQIDFAKYVTNCLYILAVSGGLALAVALLFEEPIGAALDLPPSWVWTIVLVSAGRFIVNTLLTIWQVQGRSASYARYSLLQTAGIFALAVFFIVGLGFSWQGRVLGEALSVTTLAVVGMALLWKGGWLRAGFDRGYVGHALAYSAWIIPHLYGGVLIVTVDRLMLANLVDIGEAGLYTAAAQIAMIVAVIAQAFNLAWAPWAYARMKINDTAAWKTMAKVRRLYYTGIVAIAVLLALITPLLYGILIGPRFAGAEKYALWLALGQAFMAMYTIAVTPFFFANRTHVLAIVSVSVGLLSVPFNYAFISINGPIGAAQANALTMFTMFACAAPLASRLTRELSAEAR